MFPENNIRLSSSRRSRAAKKMNPASSTSSSLSSSSSLKKTNHAAQPIPSSHLQLLALMSLILLELQQIPIKPDPWSKILHFKNLDPQYKLIPPF